MTKPCSHSVRTKVIDELGDMRDDGAGSAVAHIQKSHWECRWCGATKPDAGAKEEERVWSAPNATHTGTNQ